MQIYFSNEAIDRINEILKHEGCDVTPKFSQEVCDKLKSIWSVNLFDDICSLLEDENMDSE